MMFLVFLVLGTLCEASCFGIMICIFSFIFIFVCSFSFFVSACVLLLQVVCSFFSYCFMARHSRYQQLVQTNT